MLDHVLSATQHHRSDGAQRETPARTRLHGRRLLLARTAYVTLLILMLGLFVGGVPAHVRTLASGEAGIGMTYALYLTVLDILLVLGFGIPALIIFWRKSDDWMGMFMSLVLVIVAVRWTGEGRAFLALYPHWSGVIVFVVLAVLYKVSVLVSFYIFPNGQFVPRWTRPLVGVGVVWACLAWLPWPYGVGTMLDVGLYATGLFAQVYRYRRVSSPPERQQTKWVVFGLAIAFVGVYGGLLLQRVFPTLQEPTPSNLVAHLVGLPLLYLALLMVPVTLTISILRYRLYDIDLILHRTLVYVPVSALAAGLLAAIVKLTETLLLSEQQSLVAAALGALVMAAALTPIKAGTQKLVDRYFKEVPNPSKQLKAFGQQVQSRLFAVDPQEITRRLLEEAVRAFAATSGAVYLMHDGDLKRMHATRAWNGEAQLSVPLQSSEGAAPFGVIALGARQNSADYTARDRAVLQDVTHVVALAIEQDRQIE